MILLTVFSMLLIFGFNFAYCQNKNNRFFVCLNSNPLIWKYTRIISCAILLCVYFGLRWVPSLLNLIHYNLIDYDVSEFRSANLSIFFMLDLCSMLGWLLPFLCIFDWKKQYLLKPVALLSIIGGLATIFFTIPELYFQWSAKKFFIGSLDIGISNGDEPLMFIMHFWMVFLGFYVLNKNNYFNRLNLFLIFVFIIFFISYVLAISIPLKIKSHASGLVFGDVYGMCKDYYIHNGIFYQTNPSYGLLEILKLKWYISSFLLWFAIALIILISISLKNFSNYFIQNKILKYDFIPY